MTYEKEDREEIKQIKQQINQLIAQQTELEEQSIHNQHKSIYETLFKKAPLPLDSKINSIKSQIARLDNDKAALFKIVEKAQALVSDDDYPWFFSDFVSKYAYARTPYEQLGFYGVVLGGVGYTFKSFFKAYSVHTALKYPVGSTDRIFWKRQIGRASCRERVWLLV